MSQINLSRNLPGTLVRESYLSGVLAAFERFGMGAVVLDRTGRVLTHNLSSRAHVGTVFSLSRERLFFNDRAVNAKLQAAMVSAVSSGQATTIVAHRLALGSILIRLAPMAEQGAGLVLLLVSDPGHMKSPDDASLKASFGLTKTEARVSQLLLKGLSLQEVATSNNVGVETVRVQLKSIFTKTGTRRQSQLVALLTRLALFPV